jgi:hypothetical protein
MRFRIKLMRQDWLGMRAMLRPLAANARRLNDHRLLSELGYAALRLEEPQLGATLLYESRKAAGKTEPTDWRGEDIRDATLIVRVMETAKQGVAVGMAHVGRIAAAAEKAAHTVIIVEPRMVALFSRALPNITVLPFGVDPSPSTARKFVTANTNDLDAILNFDAKQIEQTFRALIADPVQTRELRKKYLQERDLPLIGISWWSSHYGKDLPIPQEWARLLRAIPAQFISLQYGNVDEDVALFNSQAPMTIIVDREIDQLRDMDSLASQIAALDLVITVSNSAAHLTGALGKPFILVRDNLFRRNWPYLSRKVPWYPGGMVIGKDRRSWDEAFAEVIGATGGMIQASKP